MRTAFSDDFRPRFPLTQRTTAVMKLNVWQGLSLGKKVIKAKSRYYGGKLYTMIDDQDVEVVGSDRQNLDAGTLPCRPELFLPATPLQGDRQSTLLTRHNLLEKDQPVDKFSLTLLQADTPHLPVTTRFLLENNLTEAPADQFPITMASEKKDKDGKQPTRPDAFQSTPKLMLWHTAQIKSADMVNHLTCCARMSLSRSHFCPQNFQDPMICERKATGEKRENERELIHSLSFLDRGNAAAGNRSGVGGYGQV